MYYVQGYCLRHVDHGMYNTASPFLRIPALAGKRKQLHAAVHCTFTAVNSRIVEYY